MSKKRDDDQASPPEVASFNEELVSFDLDDVSVEELERRFELAIGFILQDGSCGTLRCGTVTCGVLTCTTNTPLGG
ncbi:MAG TPA: hypothetical protein VLX28_17475 [Thermoanaerobaculia bacterium]|nr:hypothetical protein [Thermoanaerobaculia bacterium]